MSKAEKMLKTAFQQAMWARFHLLQNKVAKDTLRAVEQQRGKLKTEWIKMCDDYAVERLGSKLYAPGLYVYAAMARGFHEGWIPENYYGRYVVPALQGDYGRVSTLKPLSRLMFQSELFPDIGAYVNGIWLDNDLNILKESEVFDFLFQVNDKIVFKSDIEFSQGLGVHVFNRENFSLSKIKTFGNGVFQGYIKQHPFFDEIMPGSVATIRMTTVVDSEGRISIRTNMLRTGRSSDSHVKASSEIKVLGDPITGELDPEVYLPNFTFVDAHPDTGFRFGGKRIPGYEKCFDVVQQLHKKLPHVRSIGWDVIVDCEEQVKIMEWNGYGNGVRITQGVKGPVFGDLGWEKLHLGMP